MNIEIINKTKKKLPSKDLLFISEKFVKKYNLKFPELAIVFVGKQRIRTLNNHYRGKDKATDILSFSPANIPGAGAELILCPEIIFRHTNYREVLPELMNVKKAKLQEYLLLFVLVHGLLHLAGYDDCKERDRLEMIEIGEKFLDKLGFSIK